jgi:hypothetical protein
MGAANCKFLQASDCIFAGSITNVADPLTIEVPPAFLNCIRYSRVPVALLDDSNAITPGSNTLETPVFIQFDYCVAGVHEHRTAVYGEPGYGVLNAVTSGAIRFGAEDGGEMGACHHKYYSLRAEAVLDKMREFLPVGIEPVLIQDTRLLGVPPQQAI